MKNNMNCNGFKEGFDAVFDSYVVEPFFFLIGLAILLGIVSGGLDIKAVLFYLALMEGAYWTLYLVVKVLGWIYLKILDHF